MTPPSQSPGFPPVSTAEAGQKLLRFLSRRLSIPQSALHRWVRGGQIRINGHRCKAFDRIEAGDQIRIPPQALLEALPAPVSTPASALLPPLPPLLGKDGDIWAFNKPGDLPVQGGSGHKDSICSRFAEHFQGSGFIPCPAHRLDLQTTGVLMVGATHEALRLLHGWFAQGLIHKEYLCWAEGRFTLEPQLLCHWLTDNGGITAYTNPVPKALMALSYVRRLSFLGRYTLLQVRLFTGRKRQIRAQMAALGFPILGDARYGNAPQDLKLHCARMILPNGSTFSCLPPWQGHFKVDSLPPLLNNGEREAQKALTEGVAHVRR